MPAQLMVPLTWFFIYISDENLMITSQSALGEESVIAVKTNTK
jgi:hypothetical protein